MDDGASRRLRIAANSATVCFVAGSGEARMVRQNLIKWRCPVEYDETEDFAVAKSNRWDSCLFALVLALDDRVRSVLCLDLLDFFGVTAE